MQSVIKWHPIDGKDENMIADEMKLIFVTNCGEMFVGIKDEFGFYYQYGDEVLDEVIYWAMLPILPKKFDDARITSDEVVTIWAKKGLLDK